jgi:hypothetical protein
MKSSYNDRAQLFMCMYVQYHPDTMYDNNEIVQYRVAPGFSAGVVETCLLTKELLIKEHGFVRRPTHKSEVTTMKVQKR